MGKESGRQAIWQPVIELLHEAGALGSLLPLLLSRLGSASSGRSRSQLKAWAYLMIAAFAEDKEAFAWPKVLAAFEARPEIHQASISVEGLVWASS